MDENDVQIHAIGIHDRGLSMEDAGSPRILEDPAKMTGGQYHKIDKLDELPALARRMSLALHDRYLLGSRPTPFGRPGTFRRIEVKLVQPKGTRRFYVHGRPGYWIP